MVGFIVLVLSRIGSEDVAYGGGGEEEKRREEKSRVGKKREE